MAFHTTVRSPSAILVGVFFTLVTAYTLLEDVLKHGAPLTTRHVLTIAVLAGTIFFGHAFWAQVRSWRLGTSLGCAGLFLAGTAVCVVMSAGRNAEVTTTKVLVANAANTTRGSAQKDRDEARLRYQAAMAAEEFQCGTGNGPKCAANRITRMVRREEYDAAEAALRAQKPEQVANGDVKAAATLFARLPLVSADATAIEAILLLAFPFLQSLFCEVAAICGFAMGLGHRKALPGAKAPATVRQQLPEFATVHKTVANCPEPIKPLPREQVLMPDEAKAVFDALDQLSGRCVSNDELAKLMGVTKGEASRRASIACAVGLITRKRSGRYVEIDLVERRH